jgi:hypothetical protein
MQNFSSYGPYFFINANAKRIQLKPPLPSPLPAGERKGVRDKCQTIEYGYMNSFNILMLNELRVKGILAKNLQWLDIICGIMKHPQMILRDEDASRV